MGKVKNGCGDYVECYFPFTTRGYGWAGLGFTVLVVGKELLISCNCDTDGSVNV